jgi:hypothetical protein
VTGQDEVVEGLGKIVLPGTLVVGNHAHPRQLVGEERQREGVPSLICADAPEPGALLYEHGCDLLGRTVLTRTVRQNAGQPLCRVMAEHRAMPV